MRIAEFDLCLFSTQRFASQQYSHALLTGVPVCQNAHHHNVIP
ncbi:hypothetical protein ExPEC_2916 [Escherichia coli]|nr:hypothetical protein ExPEC_2916 [Escherichia coli]